MSWKYLDDFLFRLSKGSTLLGKYWVTFILLFRLVVLSMFGEHVWSDEQREFTCNTKQPGCENVCFNKFAPVSNVRMWGMQMLSVSIPGAFYFVYVLHVVSREKNRQTSSDDVTNSQNLSILNKDKRNNDHLFAKGELHGARKRWKVLTKYVIPVELGKKRGLWVWRMYLLQVFARIALEGLFVSLQFNLYTYRWTVPEVYRCHVWPCPHTVDCFISRPHEKTVFFRYMYLISFISVAVSIAELLHISWASLRNTHEKRRHPEVRKRRNLPSYVSRDKWLVDEKRDPEVLLTHPEVRLKVNSLTFSSNSSNSHVTTPPTDYVEVRSNNLISYL
ncbi:gap junction beta-2 protein-like isoform X4 [Clavelina lepadiformis]|uniref:gap junction beta-2 protein-like isoform X4 n=1 Tax=Clavelina lepadiformis TaxID=159417 RepID=UPI0040432C0B